MKKDFTKIFYFFLILESILGFQIMAPPRRLCRVSRTCMAAQEQTKQDNKAMAFLRKKGKVGGSANQFTKSMGVDEGPVGKSTGASSVQSIRKAKSAFQTCTDSGIIDDLSEPFPFTSSGNEWSAFTDAVMGGKSSGSMSRETVNGQAANVLRGKVSLANNGGFVQMATNLALDSVSDTVDASDYDGIELDVIYQGDEETSSFNVHLRNPACTRQFSSYRATFEIPVNTWTKIRLPWSEFTGYGPGSETTPFDAKALRRIGLVSIRKEMNVCLGLGELRFYSVI
jgi:hypothetical protein